MQTLRSAADEQHYTLMSLCDVIYHACTAMSDTFELASQAMPLLCQHFGSVSEHHALFSLTGKQEDPASLKECRVFVECLLALVSILKSRVEPYARELIHRAIALAQQLLPNAADPLQCELVKKVIELIQSVFKSLLITSSESLLGVAPLHYSLELQRDLFVETRIVDFFVACFSSN